MRKSIIEYIFHIYTNLNHILAIPQVRYMSLMPLVRLWRTGYCFNMFHVRFFCRYKMLNPVTWPNYSAGSLIEGIATIIERLPLPMAEFVITRKRVFIRSPRTVFELEELRRSRLDELALLIQTAFRCYSNRKRFLVMRRSQIVIARAWRTWRVRVVHKMMIEEQQGLQLFKNFSNIGFKLLNKQQSTFKKLFANHQLFELFHIRLFLI